MICLALVCCKTLNCAHQVIKDVRTHIAGKNHQRLSREMEAQTQLSFRPDPIADKVSHLIIPFWLKSLYTYWLFCYFHIIRAEVKVANFIDEHNLPLAISDHLTPLSRDIFSDSMVAKKYASCRTKATSILNFAIAPHFRGTLFHLKTANLWMYMYVYVCVCVWVGGWVGGWMKVSERMNKWVLAVQATCMLSTIFACLSLFYRCLGWNYEKLTF